MASAPSWQPLPGGILTPRISVAQMALQKDRSSLPIMERIANRVPFHEHRERALKAPELARDQLAHYAVLKLKLVKGTKLIAADANYHRIWAEEKASSDPYCMVLVEDNEQARTPTVQVCLEPKWNCDLEVNIHTANDVVQLRVMDQDTVSSDDLLGFVEFPVADLPLNEWVKGWFSLTSKDKLQGTSAQRLEKAMRGMDLDLLVPAGETPHEEVAGSILVELCLQVVSGDRSDQIFAFGLPQREPKVYPTTGYRRDREPMDAQAFYDRVELIALMVMDSMVRPAGAFVEYVATWQEAWLSLLCTCSAVTVALFPLSIVPMVSFVDGVFLLAMRSPWRRTLMSLSPYSVPLNDEGYSLVSTLESSVKMMGFLQRVVKVMHGDVLDRDRFQDFAAFAAEDGKPATSYRDLKAQLRDASKIGTPFVSFPTTPMKDGTLVLCESTGREGEVLKHLDAKGNTYLVVFGHGEHSEKVECRGDDLQVRLDLRWMSSGPVLALIPDGFEDFVTHLQPTVDEVGRQLESLVRTARSIVTWETDMSLYITVALFSVSALFGWIVMQANSISLVILIWLIKIIVAACVAFPHIWFAHFAVQVRARFRAERMARTHAAMRPSSWPFYTTDALT